MKWIVSTPGAPSAIGPYSQAVQVEGLLFCSGQIPLDPNTMQVVGSTAAEQTKQILANMRAILKAAKCDMSHVVKTTIFLKNMGDFSAVNEVYADAFPLDPPARSTVEVARLPKDVLVEIEFIAAVK